MITMSANTRAAGNRLESPIGERARSGGARRGMTLLEVIIALSLTALLLTGVYVFYSNTLRTRDAADELTKDTQLARVTLTRIADDIRHAGGYTPGFGVGLTGERESITIYRYRKNNRIPYRILYLFFPSVRSCYNGIYRVAIDRQRNTCDQTQQFLVNV